MNRFITLICCASLVIACSFSASGHSGRTDSSGGHYNRKTGEYHYHGGSSASGATSGSSSTRSPSKTYSTDQHSSGDADTSGPSLASELDRLRRENRQLRKENQRLRRLLASRGAPHRTPSEASTGQRSTSAEVETQQQTQTHWITNSSRKRHNSNCRYFRNSRGRMCGPNEGIACKICGG